MAMSTVNSASGVIVSLKKEKNVCKKAHQDINIMAKRQNVWKMGVWYEKWGKEWCEKWDRKCIRNRILKKRVGSLALSNTLSTTTCGQKNGEKTEPKNGDNLSTKRG